MSTHQYVTTGDRILTEPGYLRGHGTQLSRDQQGEQLVSSVCGFVERVNKLISVRPLNSRYQGEVGDVIVGRITEVGDKVWRVNVNSRQDALLMLSSVNLPGGAQRRRTDADSLQMRNFFQENDLISAEVQKLNHDGGINLHTRNDKYGKLSQGQFVRVPALSIKRCKQHFHTLECGVNVILGNNGHVWVTGASPEGQEHMPSVDDREKVARISNCILALAKAHIAIYKETILDVYEESRNLGLPAREVLNPQLLATVTRTALTRLER